MEIHLIILIIYFIIISIGALLYKALDKLGAIDKMANFMTRLDLI